MMLIVQTILLKKCLEIEIVEKSSKLESSNIVEDDPVEKLNDVLSKFLTGFMVYFFLFMFYKDDTLTAVTGSLSAICEACLPLPQFINNLRNKSVESVRWVQQFYNGFHVGLG